MPKFLHVGCGMKRKDRTTSGFNLPEWAECRLDIDATVKPDIVGTMTDMSRVSDASMNALFSSHNIEHLYPHEVQTALSEFHRVLASDGFAVITCPDLQSVCELVAQDKLMEPAYQSPAGPISPIDMLYGFRKSVAAGNHFMAHRTGFTQRSLINALRQAGFATVVSRRQPTPQFALWAIASKSQRTDSALKALCQLHFPK